MSTWLKLLPLELSGINKPDLIDPEYPLGKTDHLVGEMSDMARQLFTLGRLLEKAASQNKLDAQYCIDGVKKAELQARARELMAKSEVLKNLMWIGINDQFGLWGESVGIRTGFKVVTLPDTEGDMPPFVKRILGLE